MSRSNEMTKIAALVCAFACTLPAARATAAEGEGDLPRLWREPSSGMEFVLVKGGCYEMGDTFGDGDHNERPVHEVCVDDFYMGKYEVTQGQWSRIMGNNPAAFPKGDDYPVESRDLHPAPESGGPWPLSAAHRGGMGVCLPQRRAEGQVRDRRQRDES